MQTLNFGQIKVQKGVFLNCEYEKGEELTRL